MENQTNKQEKKMTQQEYMQLIKKSFHYCIEMNEEIINRYCYNDERARNLIANFKQSIKSMGLKLSDAYHANNIGNNNDYTIYLEEIDDDGFIIKKEIANFYYCYGIYGGCFVYLRDIKTGEQIKVGHAR